MIPKIIHYVWIGANPMPTEFALYVSDWKKIMPDYQFMEWNDSNIRELLNEDRFLSIIQWGYADRKHLGFLSDLIRYAALVKYGGFYIDTDVEVFKRFDIFLEFHHVFGYIFDALMGTAVLGAEKGSIIYKDLLDYLVSAFRQEGKLTVSNVYVTEYLMKHIDGFLLNGKNRIYKNVIVFSKDVFERYSPNRDTGYSWHHCGGSWYGKQGGGIKNLIKRLLGKRLYYWLVHKYCMGKATFKMEYKRDRQIDNKNMFLIKNGTICFLEKSK